MFKVLQVIGVIAFLVFLASCKSRVHQQNFSLLQQSSLVKPAFYQMQINGSQSQKLKPLGSIQSVIQRRDDTLQLVTVLPNKSTLQSILSFDSPESSDEFIQMANSLINLGIPYQVTHVRDDKTGKELVVITDRKHIYWPNKLRLMKEYFRRYGQVAQQLKKKERSGLSHAVIPTWQIAGIMAGLSILKEHKSQLKVLPDPLFGLFLMVGFSSGLVKSAYLSGQLDPSIIAIETASNLRALRNLHNSFSKKELDISIEKLTAIRVSDPGLYIQAVRYDHQSLEGIYSKVISKK